MRIQLKTTRYLGHKATWEVLNLVSEERTVLGSIMTKTETMAMAQNTSTYVLGLVVNKENISDVQNT